MSWRGYAGAGGMVRRQGVILGQLRWPQKQPLLRVQLAALTRPASAALRAQVGSEQPEERRDLAVLLMHAGQLGRARVEMEAYADAIAEAGSSRAEPFDRLLMGRLLEVLRGMEVLEGGAQALSVEAVLAVDDDEVARRIGTKKVPLTW
jgi:hypothetical protein